MDSGLPDGLRIRRAEPADHVGFADTMATPATYGGTLQLPYPSYDQWRERLAKIDPDSCFLVAEIPKNGVTDEPEIVAHLGLVSNGSSARRRHAMMLGISVRDAWQRRGVGQALMTAGIDRADRWMNVLRLELTVFVDNAGAIALYRRHGFVVEGTHRAYALRDGAYADVHSMARLHPRPPSLPSIVMP